MPGVNLDMRNIKWSWPGYLTFGKSKSSNPSIPQTPLEDSVTSKPQDPLHEQKEEEAKDVVPNAAQSVAVDTESLQDAMSSDHAHSTQSSSPARSLISSPAPALVSLHGEIAHCVSTPVPFPMTQDAFEGTTEESSGQNKASGAIQPQPQYVSQPSAEDSATEDILDGTTPIAASMEVAIAAAGAQKQETIKPEVSLPQYLPTTVFLSDKSEPLVTRKSRVWHATVSGSLSWRIIIYLQFFVSNTPGHLQLL